MQLWLNSYTSGQSAANERATMGYTLNKDTECNSKSCIKVDLDVIKIQNQNENESETCTHRPSLSPKGEISRNKVGVTEVAPVEA